MNYELAKKLKDAKYGGTNKTIWKGGKDLEWGGFFPFPTLSELIEACGDGFDSLDKMKKSTDSKTFVWATNLYKTTGGVEIYSTPEEAVVNLYLAIKSN